MQVAQSTVAQAVPAHVHGCAGPPCVGLVCIGMTLCCTPAGVLELPAGVAGAAPSADQSHTG